MWGQTNPALKTDTTQVSSPAEQGLESPGRNHGNSCGSTSLDLEIPSPNPHLSLFLTKPTEVSTAKYFRPFYTVTLTGGSTKAKKNTLHCESNLMRNPGFKVIKEKHLVEINVSGSTRLCHAVQWGCPAVWLHSSCPRELHATPSAGLYQNSAATGQVPGTSAGTITHAQVT